MKLLAYNLLATVAGGVSAPDDYWTTSVSCDGGIALFSIILITLIIAFVVVLRIRAVINDLKNDIKILKDENKQLKEKNEILKLNSPDCSQSNIYKELLNSLEYLVNKHKNNTK